MKTPCYQAAITLAALLLLPTTIAAAPVSESNNAAVASPQATTPTGTLEQRVATLERSLNARSKVQADQQQLIDTLQRDISELRGQLEQQTYLLNQAQERQRQLYQDMDKLAKAPAPTPAPATGAGTTTTPTTPTAPAADTPSYSTNLTENQAYDAAVDLVLKSKNYDQAIPAFRDFIKNFPDSDYVSNAHYWLGQLLFNKADRAGAKVEYLTVVDKFPTSPKRADALHKLGALAQLEGDKAQAKEFYDRAIREYPESSAAQLARQGLAKL